MQTFDQPLYHEIILGYMGKAPELMKVKTDQKSCSLMGRGVLW